MSAFIEGVEVFRRGDPGYKGNLTGKTRSKAGETYHHVSYHDGKYSYVPESDLEIVEAENLDPDWLIEHKRYGRVSDLRRNISHIQLSGKLSSLVYSMDTTNTEFYPYQFKPVLSFLESPSQGLLIADEVGLGKTIEAGLIWTELRARYDARRLLVVCPAMLCEKWRDELRNRFGVDATIMNAAELLLELKRNPNEIRDGKGIICSRQGISPPKGWKKARGHSSPRQKLAEFFDDKFVDSSLLDLVIIDEAHHLRNPETQSAKLGRMLRDISENMLLLSATPINLKNEDLFSLLNLVDPDTFDVKDFFPQVLQANEPLIHARNLALDIKSDVNKVRQALVEASGHELLGNSLQLKHLISKLDDSSYVSTRSDRVKLADSIERLNLLRHVVSRTRKADVTEWKVVRRPHSQFVELDKNGLEWKFYNDVTESIREYAIGRNISDGFLLASPQRQVSSCMYAAAKAWKDKKIDTAELIYEDLGKEIDGKEQGGALMAHLALTVLPSVDMVKLRQDDSKYKEFRQVIDKYLRENPGEKIIVFSFFRGTLSYLQERLAEENVSSRVLVGGMKESKQEVINEFREDPSVRVLLSSEVASEGVDLQFSRMIVNYDLPWNPMKIEQRIGRLDRIGQKADKIVIWNLGCADTIDHHIYKRLFERMDIFRRALGGMEEILGEEIKNLTGYLLSHKLTPSQEQKRIEQTATAAEQNRLHQDQLEKDASNLIAHGGYILERVRTAHNLNRRITDEDLVVYVKDFLLRHAPGHDFHQPDSEKLLFNIQLPAKMATELDAFIRSKRLLGQTNLATGDRIQCEFTNKVGNVFGPGEQISQFHPLIRFIGAEINRQGEEFYPVIAARIALQDVELTQEIPAGHYAFAVNRWEFIGLRNEEDLRAAVIHLETGLEVNVEDSWSLINALRTEGRDWPEVVTQIVPDDLNDVVFDCVHLIQIDFESNRNTKINENSDRVNFQIHSAEKHRDRQVETIENVLEHYRSHGQTRMIPATLGRLEKIKTRFDMKIAELQNKATLDSRNRDVCCGALFLQGEASK